MNAIVQIKRVMMFLFVVGIVPLFAMENKKNGSNLQPAELSAAAKRRPSLPKYEFLVYPDDVEVVVDGKLPDDVRRLFGNTFTVPEGMDSTLIHPTLIPQRVPDFQINQVI